eukprot:jgi/Mesvir1/13869/Mv16009-RA.1
MDIILGDEGAGLRHMRLPVLLPLTPDDYPRMAEMKAFVALADKWRSLIAGDEGPVMGGFPFGSTGTDSMASGVSSWGEGAGESVFQPGGAHMAGFPGMQRCWCCKAFVPVLRRCAQCRVAGYCSRECQKEDWKAGHKGKCAQMAA